MLITGGAGFIGSHFVRYVLNAYRDYRVINLDKLTYAGNLDNLLDVVENPRYEFVRGDICDAGLVNELMQRVDLVVNFAAESHVDRSIMGAEEFMKSNALGVYTLLAAARDCGVEQFLQVSTDEVYGSLEEGEDPWTEDAPVAPRNPYAVAKASGDLMARAFAITYEKILEYLEKPKDLMQHVTDRPGHDMRYSLDASKIMALGWKPKYNFEEALRLTVEWYLGNEDWWRKIRDSASYREYYRRQYEERK
ncbi:Low-salt glycan biosynthesis protein Agl12 [Geodia barretti]|uniref:Low-salt glycan biosynthesis protein Agl12 n=1 Tax=Geodia barretti TaxID=519541 RepID=A0AA35TXC8_GEOBA|nr:Low-salt glycan biosynthesis protein Agl12 [Geodia barretti]